MTLNGIKARRFKLVDDAAAKAAKLAIQKPEDADIFAPLIKAANVRELPFTLG